MGVLTVWVFFVWWIQKVVYHFKPYTAIFCHVGSNCFLSLIVDGVSDGGWVVVIH